MFFYLLIYLLVIGMSMSVYLFATCLGFLKLLFITDFVYKNIKSNSQWSFPQKKQGYVHDVGWLLLILSLCKIGLFKETFWPRVFVYCLFIHVLFVILYRYRYCYCLRFLLLIDFFVFCPSMSVLICCRFVVVLLPGMFLVWFPAAVIHCTYDF